ncbi:MAG: serine O-acetyltransferase [Candidatus Melainabacteria bacterium GWA2_34_9]|nr:MAG: serine O-acetyltransferase [Candidatus Melainabacteria bacterium GWA2_34_9]
MFLTRIKEDIQTIFDNDPAAKTMLEVVLCYPGLHALLMHRAAHKLYKEGIPLLPRVISNISRIITGVEIHPGAQIGKQFFIDHGMGVVIGETTIIGDNVLVYQGVTLGGTGKETGKRHPTLKNDIVVGSGAKILGNITIGNNVRVGAGSVVIEDVPDDSTVVGIPGRVVVHKGQKNHNLQHNVIPDPIKDALSQLTDEIKDLKDIVKHDICTNENSSDSVEEEYNDGAGI